MFLKHPWMRFSLLKQPHMQLWHFVNLELFFHPVATRPFKILIPSSKAPLVLYKYLFFCFQTADAHLALKSYVVFQMLNLLIKVDALPAPLATTAVRVLNRTWSKANITAWSAFPGWPQTIINYSSSETFHCIQVLKGKGGPLTAINKL